jgi:hypothetical protein
MFCTRDKLAVQPIKVPFKSFEWGELQRTDSGLSDNHLLINDLSILAELI